jgi:hypothetical protein
MYKVYFDQTNEVFNGGSLQNSKWNLMPDKPIKKLVYQLDDKCVVAENFESYNHLIEHVSFLNKNMPTKISKVSLLLKRKEDCVIITFSQQGITEEIIDLKDLPKVTGWKRGILNQQSNYKIL